MHFVNYEMDVTDLQCVSREKGLGVEISEDLKLDNQCKEVVSKANKILGMIKQNFTERMKESILTLYKSLVRLHLDYCSQIWNPHYVKNIKLIEGVQRRATKVEVSVKHLHCDERLKHTGFNEIINVET